MIHFPFSSDPVLVSVENNVVVYSTEIHSLKLDYKLDEDNF